MATARREIRLILWKETDADRSGNVDALVREGKLAGFLINRIDFYAVAVAAGAQEEASVRGNRKIPRMDASILIAGGLDLSGLLIH